MSCPSYCYNCCKCCFHVKDSKEKYPHVTYKPPGELKAGGMPEFYTIPLEKIFQQPETEYPILPGITEAAVAQQPLGETRETPEPLPTSRQFASHVVYMHSDQCALPVDEPSSSTRGEVCPVPIDRKRAAHEQIVRQRTVQSLPSHQQQGIAILEQTDLSAAEAKTSPMLQFSVYLDVQASILSIDLIKGTNLSALWSEASPRKGHPSMFVILYLQPTKEEVYRSKLVPKFASPEFHEQFNFARMTIEEVRTRSVVFRIYEGTKPTRKNLIGSVVLPLKDVDVFGVVTTMKINTAGESLLRGSQGDALISLRYDSGSQTIQGTVIKAANLMKQDFIGLADPYMKVCLMHKGARRARWKTSVKKNTLTPIFNESFQFDVSQMYIEDLSLEFTLMDHDRFTHDDKIGAFVIGKHSFSESGRLHWDEAISSPRVAVSRWHSVVAMSQDLRAGSV